jgi:hypothetical protein
MNFTTWQLLILTLKTEHGCRTLIDLFLLDAADKSNSDAAIFPEWKVFGVVDGLKIGGSLDYLISLVGEYLWPTHWPSLPPLVLTLII